MRGSSARGDALHRRRSPHHIVYRSAGGSDDPGNQISLCAAHHLHGVHMGWIRVSGTAPDGLRWELGVGAAP